MTSIILSLFFVIPAFFFFHKTKDKKSFDFPPVRMEELLVEALNITNPIISALLIFLVLDIFFRLHRSFYQEGVEIFNK